MEKKVTQPPKLNTSGVLNLQKKWNAESSKDKQLMKFMDDWKKTKARLLVLGIPEPEKESAQSENEFEKSEYVDDEDHGFLSSVSADDEDFEDFGVIISYTKEALLAFNACKFDPNNDCNNAERNKNSERQLVQHLQALVFLINAVDQNIKLSPQLITKAHGYLMKGLIIRYEREDYDVRAGKYRKQTVVTGINHIYPDHGTIPTGIVKIVTDHEKRFTQQHDPFELACWLHLEIVSLHPFLDGNGRIARLLWCYSLMRDGLPFPVTPLSIPRIAEYTQCVLADANSKSPRPENLISLTLTRVVETWKQFLHDLEEEKGGSVAFTDFSKWLGEEIGKMK